MAKVLLLLALVCVAIVQTVLATQCYNCVSMPGDKNCDEFNDESKIPKITCGKSINEKSKSVCMKKIIEEKSSKSINTTRTCVILNQDGKTDDVCRSTSDRYAVTECQVCMYDLCNGGTNLNVNFMAILGTSTLLLIKFLY